MSPPTCRTCGKAEWSHLCGGKPKRVRKAYARDYYDKKRRAKLGHKKRTKRKAKPAAVVETRSLEKSALDR